MVNFTVPAGLPFSDCKDENALFSHADAMRKEELLLLIKKHFPSAECDDKTLKDEFVGKFVEHVAAQRTAGLKDLTFASGVEKDSHSSRSSTSSTAGNIVALQNALSEIRAVVGPPTLGNSSYLSVAHLGSLAVQSLCTVVTGQLSLYRTVHGRVNAGAALPQNERFFRALVVEFRAALASYKASAVELSVGYVPIGTISFVCLLQALSLPSGVSAQQAIEGLRHLDLRLGQAGSSLTPLYSYLKSVETKLRKAGVPAIEAGQLAEALFHLEDAPLRNWMAIRAEIPTSMSLALSAVHVKVMKNEKVTDEDIKGLMDALALEASLMDLCALQGGPTVKDNLIAWSSKAPASPSPAVPAEKNKTGGICLNYLRAGGCRRKNCRLGHYDSDNPVAKHDLEQLCKDLANIGLVDPGDLSDDKIRAGNITVKVLKAALRPVGSPRTARPAGKRQNKKEEAALVAAVREVLTGIGAPVATGAVPATPVQATAFSLLTPPPPPPSDDVAAAISTISSHVTDQQRTTFQALSDKEFRDHFAKTFNL